MRLWYMRTILLPNNSQDVLDVPIGFEHFVEWYGNWYMARIFAPDRARDAKDEWQSAWVEIIADDNETHDWAEAH